MMIDPFLYFKETEIGIITYVDEETGRCEVTINERPAPYDSVPNQTGFPGLVGTMVRIGFLSRDRQFPYIIDDDYNRGALSVAVLVTINSIWYQFHMDKSCSEIISYTMFDTSTILDEKIYWTMEA